MIGYHFTGDILRDGRPIPAVGEWLEHDGPVVPCKSGLHASEHPFDALTYAPGGMLHLVELDGDLASHGDPVDKWVGRRRRIIASIDATALLREFARWCALQVIDLWDAPAVVRDYLTTGEESLRADAEAAALSAALVAARDAVAWAADMAAGGAAGGDATVAARAAAVAGALAHAAADAGDAAQKEQRRHFAKMVEATFEAKTKEARP